VCVCVCVCVRVGVSVCVRVLDSYYFPIGRPQILKGNAAVLPLTNGTLGSAHGQVSSGGRKPIYLGEQLLPAMLADISLLSSLTLKCRR
jgi:hypothetical protein